MEFFQKAKEWMTPERAAAFQGIGMGLSQLSAGQPVDLSPAYDALQQRKDAAQMRKVMEVPGLMDSFTPQQRAVLASMPESLATKIIMEQAFQQPDPVNYQTFTGPDGSVYAYNPTDPTNKMVLAQGQPATPEPNSAIAKLQADLKAGLITQEQYDIGVGAIAKGDATTVTLDMGGGTDKQIFDTVNAQYGTVAPLVPGMTSLMEAQKAIDAGAITGFGADGRLDLARLGAYLGITDPAAVQNTETFKSAIAPQVAAMLKATAGTANLSNADREFAEKAAGGNITLDEGSIKRLIGIMTKASTTAINTHNRKVNEIYPETEDGRYARERSLFLLPEPVIPEPTPEPQPSDAPAVDFSGAGINDLLAVDINTLDAAGMDAWEKRYNELQGGN